MKKPILCLDFDGVLHSYTSGWKGPAIASDPPVNGSKIFLLEALDVFEVCIYSSRSHQEGGITAMRKWCQKHFGHNITEKIDFPEHKPPAHIIIDDRGFRFIGIWPNPKELKSLQPWNKRKV